MIISMEEQKMSFNDALEFVSASNVFTTHTPVPAGNDRFDVEMIDQYLGHYIGKLKLSKEKFLSFGRENPSNKKETFCMTVLALKTAAYANGVSKLHGDVSRNMWKNIWSQLPAHEVPIGHITNGIQTMSWTSDEMMRLYNRYLGPKWIDNPGDNTIWENIDDIPDSELWRCRERLRERLVSFARKLQVYLIPDGFGKQNLQNFCQLYLQRPERGTECTAKGCISGTQETVHAAWLSFSGDRLALGSQ